VDVHDNYDEKMVEQSNFGPVITINNLEKPQPLIDPEAGMTQKLPSRELTPEIAVEIEITKVNVSLLVSELDDRNARITYNYNIEVTASVQGDEIDHIDLYFGVKDKSSDLEWTPLMDVDNLENYFPEDPRYWDDYYALFINPELDGDVWVLEYEYTDKVKKDEVPGGMSINGEIGREYKISAVAWTRMMMVSPTAGRSNISIVPKSLERMMILTVMDIQIQWNTRRVQIPMMPNPIL
jgi:hypothetical protein